MRLAVWCGFLLDSLDAKGDCVKEIRVRERYITTLSIQGEGAAPQSKGNLEAILFRPKAVFSSKRPVLDVPNRWGGKETETSGRKTATLTMRLSGCLCG